MYLYQVLTDPEKRCLTLRYNMDGVIVGIHKFWRGERTGAPHRGVSLLPLNITEAEYEDLLSWVVGYRIPDWVREAS